MSASEKNIKSFLETGSNSTSRFLSYVGLTVGMLLLFTSLQTFININSLVREKNPRQNGFDFISVTKNVTDQTMGTDNRFNATEISEMKKQPSIANAAPLLSNQFRVKASAGKIIPFTTDLFLEAVTDQFIDTVPPAFSWQPGQRFVPIIFSADFLEMYNVFAPAQDLPQLSVNSIAAISITLECFGPTGIENFTGHVVAVTDRINSVLVPENFLIWANQKFGNSIASPASRVYVKTKDANDPALLNFLEKNNYRVNKDRTKFGRIKTVLQAVVTGLGVFSILIIALAMMLFSFYLQLVIARSRENLLLLITLGYSPKSLRAIVVKKTIRGILFSIAVALLLTAALQIIVSKFTLTGRSELSPWLHWAIAGVAVILVLISAAINIKVVDRIMKRL